MIARSVVFRLCPRAPKPRGKNDEDCQKQERAKCLYDISNCKPVLGKFFKQTFDYFALPCPIFYFEQYTFQTKKNLITEYSSKSKKRALEKLDKGKHCQISLKILLSKLMRPYFTVKTKTYHGDFILHPCFALSFFYLYLSVSLLCLLVVL